MPEVEYTMRPEELASMLLGSISSDHNKAAGM